MMYNGKTAFQFYDEPSTDKNDLVLQKAGTYVSGDVIEIRRKGNEISFVIKGQVVYTSNKKVDDSKTLVFAHTPTMKGAGLIEVKAC